MTIEEKLKAKSFTQMESDNFHIPTMHLHKQALFLDDAISICQQEIKSACDKQKEICFIEWGNVNSVEDEYDAIKNAPYPEGVK